MEEWIPMEKQVPQKGELALFCGIKGGIFLGTYCGVGLDGYQNKSHRARRDRDHGSAKSCQVIAWLPVPEPYVDKEKLAKFKEIESAYLHRKRLRRMKW